MQRFLRKTPRSLDYGVMVAQQVLVLFVQVRILVVQQPIKEKRLSQNETAFFVFAKKSGKS